MTTLSTPITASDGFHHLVYSISGTTHTLFFDNSAVSININSGNIFSLFPNISNLFFGTAGDLSYGYTGFLDDVKIFNRALTTADVSAIYNTYATPKSAFSNYAITSIAQLLFPFTADFTNQGVYTSYSSSNVTTPSQSGTTFFTTIGSKLCVRNVTIHISGLYSTSLFRTGYTISVWFFLPGNVGDWNANPLILYNNTGGQLLAWNPCNMPWSRNSAGFYFGNGGYFACGFNANSTWNHLVLTVNSSNVCTGYFNGSNCGSANAPLLSLNKIQLFDSYALSARFLSVFNSVLTSTQITQLYNEQLTI